MINSTQVKCKHEILLCKSKAEISVHINNAYYKPGLKPDKVIRIIQVNWVTFYPGQPGHALSESSGSDLVYKISRSDPDSALDQLR